MTRTAQFRFTAGFLGLIGILALLSLPSVRRAERQPSANGDEMHGVWATPSDLGRSSESVKAFVSQCRRANINLILLLAKGMKGQIYWQSRRFPQAVMEGYETFDLFA